MNIVLPIVFFAVIVGLFAPTQKMRYFRWIVALWIAIIIANYWMKN